MRHCWTTAGAGGHCPDLHLHQHLSALLSSVFASFFCQKSWNSPLGCSSVHSDGALSSAGPEPTRLRIRGLRPGQGTGRTYQGPPAGVCLPVGWLSIFFWRRWSGQSLCASLLPLPMWPRGKKGWKMAEFIREPRLVKKAALSYASFLKMPYRIDSCVVNKL